MTRCCCRRDDRARNSHAARSALCAGTSPDSLVGIGLLNCTAAAGVQPVAFLFPDTLGCVQTTVASAWQRCESTGARCAANASL